MPACATLQVPDGQAHGDVLDAAPHLPFPVTSGASMAAGAVGNTPTASLCASGSLRQLGLPGARARTPACAQAAHSLFAIRTGLISIQGEARLGRGASDP